MTKRLILMVLATWLAGCGSDDLDGGEPKADGADFCEVYGWYGDGYCDETCSLPDPDCASSNNVDPPDDGRPQPDPPPRGGDPEPSPDPTPDPVDPVDPVEPPDDRCTAEPVCSPGELPVSAMTCLAAQDECESHEACGIWAHCLAVPDVCPDVEGTPPMCPAGTAPVDECFSEECVIARGTGDACSSVLFCEAEVQCLALASCAPEQVNVSTEACLGLGEACQTVTTCGQTVHCVDIRRDCPEAEGTPPACPAGTESTSSCLTRELNHRSCLLTWGTDDQCSNYLYCSVRS